jgi:hypothetical protein
MDLANLRELTMRQWMRASWPLPILFLSKIMMMLMKSRNLLMAVNKKKSRSSLMAAKKKKSRKALMVLKKRRK